MFLSIVLDLHILNLCEFLRKPDFNYSRIHYIKSVIRIVTSSFTALLTAANRAQVFRTYGFFHPLLLTGSGLKKKRMRARLKKQSGRKNGTF